MRFNLNKIKTFFGINPYKYSSWEKEKNIQRNQRKIKQAFKGFLLSNRQKVKIFNKLKLAPVYVKGKGIITKEDIRKTRQLTKQYFQEKSPEEREKEARIKKEKELQKFEFDKNYDQKCRRLLYKKALPDFDSKKAAKKLISHARFRHSWLKLFAVSAAYIRFKLGETLPIFAKDGKKEPETRYVVDRVIQTKRSLGITVLVPEGPNKNLYEPVIMVRGTQNSENEIDFWNIRDDFSKDIGTKSYEPMKEKIHQMIRQLAKKYGPVTITGHSLGGKISQLIYLDNMAEMISVDDPGSPTGKKKVSVIKEAVFFGAPGTTFRRLEEFRKKQYKMDLKGYDVPNAVDYYLEKDLAHRAGGPHIYTKRFVLEDRSSKFKWEFKPQKFARNFNTFFRETHIFNNKHLYELKYKRHKYTWIQRSFNWTIERMRYLFKGMLKFFFKEIFRQQNIYYFFDSEGLDISRKKRAGKKESRNR